MAVSARVCSELVSRRPEGNSQSVSKPLSWEGAAAQRPGSIGLPHASREAAPDVALEPPSAARRRAGPKGARPGPWFPSCVSELWSRLQRAAATVTSEASDRLLSEPKFAFASCPSAA